MRKFPSGSSLSGKRTFFAEKILANVPELAPAYRIAGFKPKLHTIREDKAERWKEGRAIHMAYGVRTLSFEKINEFPSGQLYPGIDKCTGTQLIEVRYHEEWKAREGKTTETVYAKPFEVKGTTFYIPIMVFVRNKPGEPERALTIEQMRDLAVNDGFESLEEFFEWFSDSCKGKLIHWTKKRY